MKSIILSLTLFITGASMFGQNSFYDFTVKDINGQDFPLSQLKGKKVMIVNTASKCGHTPQYADLEDLYKKYRDKNFIIIGFPANNFMKQEPGTDAEIKEFCQKNYGVTFPMMSKISVKGEDMHPLYKWLTTKDMNKFKDSEVKWNFQKYLISESGSLVSVLSPQDRPNSQEIIDWIVKK